MGIVDETLGSVLTVVVEPLVPLREAGAAAGGRGRRGGRPAGGRTLRLVQQTVHIIPAETAAAADEHTHPTYQPGHWHNMAMNDLQCNHFYQ